MFVDAVVQTPVAMMDPHWKIQYYHTCVEDIAYDFIGKIENIGRDIAHVCAKTKMNLAFFKKFSPHSVSASSKLGQFYTPRIREKVLEKYAKDFEFFGYDPKI